MSPFIQQSNLNVPSFYFPTFPLHIFTFFTADDRMMMLDEEQISFRSASLMFDGIEDYSHQIAEMIGLRNESNFIQAGVSEILLIFFCIFLCTNERRHFWSFSSAQDARFSCIKQSRILVSIDQLLSKKNLVLE